MFSPKKFWLSAVTFTLVELCTINPLQALTLNFRSTDGFITGSFTTLDNPVLYINPINPMEKSFYVKYLRLSSTTSDLPFPSMYTDSAKGISRINPQWNDGRPLIQEDIFIHKGIGSWYWGTPEINPPSINYYGIYLFFGITLKCQEGWLNCLGASGKMSLSYQGNNIITLPWHEKSLVVTERYEEPTSPQHSVPEPSSLLGLLLLGGGWLLERKRREKLPNRNSASL
jgi:hypothetical protein